MLTAILPSSHLRTASARACVAILLLLHPLSAICAASIDRHAALLVEDSKVADAPLLAFDIVCPKRVYTLVAEDSAAKIAWMDALRALYGRAYASEEERASTLSVALAGGDEAGASPKRPSVGIIRRASIRASFTLKHHAKVVKHAGQASRRGSAPPLARRLSSEVVVREGGGGGASDHSDEGEYSDAEGDDEASSRRTSGAASPTNVQEGTLPPLLPPRPQSPGVAGGVLPLRPQSDQFDAEADLAAAKFRSLSPASGPLPPTRRASKESAPRRTSSTSGGASSDSDSSLADGHAAALGGDAAAMREATPASDLGARAAGVRNSFKGNYSFQNASNTSSRGLSQSKVRRGSMGGASTADCLPVSFEDDMLRADLNEDVAENILIQVGRAAERELARTQALGASQAIAKTIVAFRLHKDALMIAAAKAETESAETGEAGAPSAAPAVCSRSHSVVRQARRRRSSGLGTNSWVPDGWGDGLEMVRWETVSYEACFGADENISSYAIEVLSELLLDDGARPELANWLQGSKRELNTIASRLTASMRGPHRAARVFAAKAWHTLLKLYSEHAIALKLSDAVAFDVTAYESLSFLRSTGAMIEMAELEPLVEIALDLCVPPSRQLWRERAALLLGDAIERGPAPESIDAFGKTLVNVATVGAVLRIAQPISRATTGAAARDGWALAAYAVKTLSMLLIHAKSAANVATILGTTEGDTFLNWIWPFFTCIAADKKVRETGWNRVSGTMEEHSPSAKERAALKKDSANAAQIYTLSINAISAVLDAIVASHGNGVGPYCRAMVQSLHRYSGWGRNETKLVASVLTGVFAKIAASSKTWRHDFSDPRWKGVIQLLEIVLDFAFSASHAPASLAREAAAADAVARYSAMPVAVLTPRNAPAEGGVASVAQRAKDIACARPLDVADVARWDACAPHLSIEGKCMDLNLVNNALRLLGKLQFEGEASVTSSHGADERATIKSVTTLKGALERARDCFVEIDTVAFDAERCPFEERDAFAAKSAGSANFLTRCKARRAFLKSPLAVQPPAALWRVLRGSSDDVDKASEGLGEAAALKYTNRTAAGLHQVRRTPRTLLLPRPAARMRARCARTLVSPLPPTAPHRLRARYLTAAVRCGARAAK